MIRNEIRTSILIFQYTLNRLKQIRFSDISYIYFGAENVWCHLYYWNTQNSHVSTSAGEHDRKKHITRKLHIIGPSQIARLLCYIIAFTSCQVLFYNSWVINLRILENVDTYKIITIQIFTTLLHSKCCISLL